jgi:hypothetical protein
MFLGQSGPEQWLQTPERFAGRVAGDVESVCLVLVCRTVSPAATVPAGVGAVSGSKFCSVNERPPKW